MYRFTAVLLTLSLSFSLSIHASDFTQKDLNEETVIAANWQQFATEYDALFYQAFNIARDNLTEALKHVPKGKKPVIVTDIDDTLLDGVTYSTSLIGSDGERTVERSIHWWNNQPLTALPGTVDFFKEIDALGIEVFYISGRYNDVKPATFKNLKSMGFPIKSESQILLQPAGYSTLSKEQKRQDIRNQGFHILMAIGDQLDDLAEVEGEHYTERQAWVAANSDQFARQWLMLPNTIYGFWEGALTKNYSKLSPLEKHQARMNALREDATSSGDKTGDSEFARHMTLAAIWHHTSADYHALTYQAYNQASHILSKQPMDTPAPAIVLDIDGTVLDISPLAASTAAHQTLLDKSSRMERFLKQDLKAIPGSLAFLKQAKKDGYEIFYLSDRDLSSGLSQHSRDLESATVGNLQKQGFPDADATHVILRQEYCPENQPDCDKAFKRKALQTGKVDGIKHSISLYVGDLTTDFDLTEQGLNPGSKEDIASIKEQFGRHFIILPNPTQHTWMNRLYNDATGGKYSKMSREDQAQVRRQLVRDWEGKPDSQ